MAMMSTEQNLESAGGSRSGGKRRRWVTPVIAGGSVVLGIVIGSAGSGPEQEPVTAEPEIVTETVEVPGEVPADELEALEQREAELNEREAALDDREAGLDDREAAVETTEEQVVASTIPGDGVYVVGEDIDAGEYRTAGPSGDNPVGCYYAFLSGTGADAEIIDNNILGGQGRVSLSAGDVFETSSCEDWSRVE
jgi:hypothetical protein